MQISDQNLLNQLGDIEHSIIFWSKFSVFLSAVTLEIRSRSQSPNRGHDMSNCYIPANFGQNPNIRSGYIVHILKHILTLVLTTTPAPTGSASKYMHPTLIFCGSK